MRCRGQVARRHRLASGMITRWLSAEGGHGRLTADEIDAISSCRMRRPVPPLDAQSPSSARPSMSQRVIQQLGRTL